MSSRVSGHSDRPRMAVRAALLLTVLGLVAGPIAPLASAASGGGITLTTPFPSIVVEPGSTATFQLSLDVNAEQDVKLALQGAPADWTTRFEGDNLTIDSAFVTPAKAVEVTLSVAVPDSAQDASQSLRVTATGKDGTVTLPLTLRVQAKVGGEVTLTTDTAEKTGPASTTFTFSLTLKNGTAQDQTFSFDAQGPDPSWTVSAKPAAEAQAVSTLVKAGASTSVTVTAQAPDGVEAGTYPITVTASGAGEPVTTPTPLGIVITGSYTVAVSTPNQVLSTSANAGSPTDFVIRVTNSGTAPITQVTPSATAPTGWTVTFTPEVQPSIDATAFQDFTAHITPTSDAITGDYNVVVTAKAAEASGNVTIRVKVETPAFWWIAGLLLIVAVFAGLYWVFRTYGRR